MLKFAVMPYSHIFKCLFSIPFSSFKVVLPHDWISNESQSHNATRGGTLTVGAALVEMQFNSLISHKIETIKAPVFHHTFDTQYTYPTSSYLTHLHEHEISLQSISFVLFALARRRHRGDHGQESRDQQSDINGQQCEWCQWQNHSWCVWRSGSKAQSTPKQTTEKIKNKKKAMNKKKNKSKKKNMGKKKEKTKTKEKTNKKDKTKKNMKDKGKKRRTSRERKVAWSMRLQAMLLAPYQVIFQASLHPKLHHLVIFQASTLESSILTLKSRSYVFLRISDFFWDYLKFFENFLCTQEVSHRWLRWHLENLTLRRYWIWIFLLFLKIRIFSTLSNLIHFFHDQPKIC